MKKYATILLLICADSLSAMDSIFPPDEFKILPQKNTPIMTAFFNNIAISNNNKTAVRDELVKQSKQSINNNEQQLFKSLNRESKNAVINLAILSINDVLWKSQHDPKINISTLDNLKTRFELEKNNTIYNFS